MIEKSCLIFSKLLSINGKLVIKIARNSNSKKDKKRHDIALQDVPLCLKLHVILIRRKTKKNMNCIARCTLCLEFLEILIPRRPLQPFLTLWYMRLGRSLGDCRPVSPKGQKYQMVKTQTESH